MTGRLDGKVALITGSDSGIGQASAAEFAKEGADVVVHFLHDEGGARATSEAVGRRAVVVQADIRSEAEVASMFDQATATFGSLDIRGTISQRRCGGRARRAPSTSGTRAGRRGRTSERAIMTGTPSSATFRARHGRSSRPRSWSMALSGWDGAARAGRGPAPPLAVAGLLVARPGDRWGVMGG